MPNPKPQVAAAFVCEKILQEDKVVSAIRIVDTFRRVMRVVGPQGNDKPLNIQPSQVFDASGGALDMSVLLILRAGPDVRGRHEVTIIGRNPEGKENVIPGGPYLVDYKLNDPTETAQFKVRIFMPGNAKSGIYWLDVTWDGEPLTSIPFKLESEDEAPAHS